MDITDIDTTIPRSDRSYTHHSVEGLTADQKLERLVVVTEQINFNLTKLTALTSLLVKALPRPPYRGAKEDE